MTAQFVFSNELLKAHKSKCLYCLRLMKMLQLKPTETRKTKKKRHSDVNEKMYIFLFDTKSMHVVNSFMAAFISEKIYWFRLLYT